jgi:undecaprenyl-diphosphatase
MTLFQALILGIVQGLTEFIPVSSSGHLVIFHHLMGLDDTGLGFDVALHLGTLLALLIYFGRDIVRLLRGAVRPSQERTTVLLLALATVPAVITGALLESSAEHAFRSVVLVSINLIVVAGIMLYAEAFAKKRKHKTAFEKVNTKQALMMGGAQALAVIPGVSRSGSTIVAGLFGGLDRVSATRFSFLLAIPITLGAIAKVFSESATQSAIRSETDVFIVGIITALISGLFAIRFLLRFLAKHTLKTFAYYRIAVGVFVLLTVLF